MIKSERIQYWRTNLRYLGALLSVWFLVSYVAGLFLAEWLDGFFRVGGFPLGFWFANQGSMVVFLLIVLVYVKLMARLDDKYGANRE